MRAAVQQAVHRRNLEADAALVPHVLVPHVLVLAVLGLEHGAAGHGPDGGLMAVVAVLATPAVALVEPAAPRVLRRGHPPVVARSNE